MGRWQTVRQTWKNKYAENEQRYKASLNILKDMFDQEK